MANDAQQAVFGQRTGRPGPVAQPAKPVMRRIVGHPRYPNTPGTPAAVSASLAALRALPGHVFWGDDISLMDSAWVDVHRLLSPGQVTDSYLLALARAHRGQLASFDRRLVVDAVHDGGAVLHLI